MMRQLKNPESFSSVTYKKVNTADAFNANEKALQAILSEYNTKKKDVERLEIELNRCERIRKELNNRYIKKKQMATVNIYNGADVGRHYHFQSKHPMFDNEYLTYELDGDMVIISVPPLDHRGKMYKTTIVGGNKTLRQFGVVDEMLNIGKFEVDEESTEDELIIYYK